MWEILSNITNYLLQNGGMYGVVIIILIAYIFFKEWKSIKFEKKDTPSSTSIITPPITSPQVVNENEKSNSQDNLKDLVLLIERQQNQTKILQENSEMLINLSKCIAIIKDEISSIDKNQNSKIEDLTKTLNTTNKERLEDLKEILLEYNKVVNDLNLILKSDFSIKRRS